MEEFSDKIKKARKLKKVSVQDVANEMGVKRQSVYDWENGVSLPRQEKLDKLYKILGIKGNEPAYENVSSDLAMTLALKSLETLERNHNVSREDYKEAVAGLHADKVDLQNDKSVMVVEKRELLLIIQGLTAAIGNTSSKQA